MKVLVVGNGGREHAIVWKLANDSCRPQIYCVPGNGGTAQHAKNVEWSLKRYAIVVVSRGGADFLHGLDDRPLCVQQL